MVRYQDLLGARSKRVTDPVRLGFPQIPSHGLWVTDGYHLIQFSLALCCPSPIKWVVYWNRGVRETGWGGGWCSVDFGHIVLVKVTCPISFLSLEIRIRKAPASQGFYED